MPQDTGTKLDDFDKKILSFLLKEDWPVTTEMVADAIPSSWNTAQLHLYKLKSEGLVRGKRVGRQNQWMLTEKGKRISKYDVRNL
ncbi:MAG: helix-turn-helix transcriptional regulator [Nitrososphaerota archaeon]|nr:helix-turn-helix transcriptional regulator [Nitrososphaerota archaeon]